MRSLLNLAYVALAQSAEDVEELDRELEEWPADIGAARPRTPANSGNVAALMAAARMPQGGGQS